MSENKYNNNDIAIIGMSCRLPGNANTPEAFYQFLLNGGDGVIDVPTDRWDKTAYYDKDKTKPGKMFVTQGGFIENIDQFDPQFFGISPKEAPYIDPQHRWLLELTYEAFENAGLKISDYKGSDTAVYIGQFMHDYEQIQVNSAENKRISPHSATGPSMTLTANRISYSFDFIGASVTLDTACSSSIVALDMACKAILSGDSKVAIAGGVNILLRPELTLAICKASMLSPDCRSKSFDASANGYVRSEGAGLVLIKKMDDAVRDGDNILGIIKATGVNQDGQTIGITVPNGKSQKKLLQRSLLRANINKNDIQYAEAHGTGTPVGDPIEVNALGDILGDRDLSEKICVVGSVKSNIGHCEAAAGMAGLIKTVMAMNNGIIPKNIHFNEINPAIKLDELNISIATENQSWPDTVGKPRRAMLNSFGFGGTNANVILEQAPAHAISGSDQQPLIYGDIKLLPISSKSEQGLRDQAQAYITYLNGVASEKSDASVLHNICYSAANRREHFKYRLVLCGSTVAGMIAVLQDFIDGKISPSYVQDVAQATAEKKPCFVFSGMGTQWANMGRSLYDKEIIYKAALDKCSDALHPYLGWSLVDAMFNTEDLKAIDQTNIAQPAIFATQYALSTLLMSWGIMPGCIVGHSAGEVAAACIAGALSFDDAIKVVFHRSRLQHTTEGMGKMVAVGLSEIEIKPYLLGHEDKVSIAAVNSQQAITLAGDSDVIEALAAKLDGEGIFARILNVGVPYHSPAMDQLKQPLIDALSGITASEPTLPLYSSVTAMQTHEGDWDEQYWPRNVREPVYFKAVIEQIALEGYDNFIEISSHPALASSIVNTLKDNTANPCRVVTTLNRKLADDLALQQSLGQIHSKGIGLNWAALYPKGGQFIQLPNYAWQHASYWNEADEAKHARLNNIQQGSAYSEEIHSLLGSPLQSTATIWQKNLDLSDLSYLEGHQVADSIVYPGAAYVESALAIAHHHFKQDFITLEDIQFKRAFFLDASVPVLIESTLFEDNNGFSICALDPRTGRWDTYSQGIICDIHKTVPPIKIDLAELQKHCTGHMNKTEFYAHCHTLGLNYQGDFQLVEQAWYSDDAINGSCVVEIQIPESCLSELPDYLLHPVILDGAFQGLFPMVSHGYLPVKIDQLHYYKQPGAKCYGHLRARVKTHAEIIGDLSIFNEAGEILVEVIGVHLKAREPQASENTADNNLAYHYRWQHQALTEILEDTTNDSGEWIIFGDQKGVGQLLATELEQRSQTVRLIEAQTQFDKAEDLIPYLQESISNCRGVIYLWALDQSLPNTSQDILAACRHSTITPMYLVQALNQVSWKHQLKVCLVSQAVHQITTDTTLPQISQAPLWGFGRVFASEHSEFSVSMVDLPATIDTGLYANLVDNILSPEYEQEIALRTSGRYVNRLQKITAAELSGYTNRPLPLLRNTPIKLSWKGADPRRIPVLQCINLPALNADEVVIAVTHADASVLGTNNKTNGCGCIGIITTLGKAVTDYRVGDRVAAFSVSGQQSHIHVKANTIAIIPANISTLAALSLPGVFTIAYHALHHLANLQAGEPILIHEAADGVGLAAVKIAQVKGANIFVTAATAEKREYLKQQGVSQVYDSNSSEIFAQIREQLAQKNLTGLRIALNMLAGQQAIKTLNLVSPFGHFIDLTPERSPGVPKELLSKNISYHTVNISDLVRECPGLYREHLLEVIALLGSARLTGIEMKEISASNIGDLDNDDQVSALKFDANTSAENSLVQAIQGTNLAPIHGDGTYLVSGGLGGLGLLILDWLVANGAKSIVLTGRSGASDEALQKIATAKSQAVDVQVICTDISDRVSVEALLDQINKTMKPLAGIIHSAGVLDDGVISQLTEEKFTKVLLPKIKGAWNFHVLTSDIDLDFFICFSSIASMVGWAGQSNYAAANAFMDTLAFYRRAEGKTALTINWGPWAEVGMAANLDDRDIQRMTDAGMTPLTAATGLQTQLQMMANHVTQAGIFDVDWVKILKQYPDPGRKTVLSNFFDSDMGGASVDILALLQTTSHDVRETILTAKVREILANILGLSSGDSVDPRTNVYEYGLNSLMALDFTNHLQNILKTKLSSTLIMKYPTVELIVQYILENVFVAAGSDQQAAEELMKYWEPGASLDIVRAHENYGPLPLGTMLLNYIDEQLPNRFNVPIMMEFDSHTFDLPSLKIAMEILISYHDGLRAQVCVPKDAAPYQIISRSDDSLALEEFDFSNLSYEDGVARMKVEDNRLQDSFNFDQPEKLYRMAYFKLNHATPHRVFMVVHHYIVDFMSMMVFAQTFKTAFQRVMEGKPLYLPRKNTSLIDWNTRLNEFSLLEAEKQLPFWLDQVAKARQYGLEYSSLFGPRINKAGAEKIYEFTIDQMRSEKLIALTKEYNVELVHIIIFVMIKNFKNSTGQEALWLRMIFSGREFPFGNMNSENLFGLLINEASVLFELPSGLNQKQQMQAIQQQHTQVPGNGAGLMDLRFLSDHPDTQDLPLPNIEFNYSLDFTKSSSLEDGVSHAREGVAAFMTGVPKRPKLDFYVEFQYSRQGLVGQIVCYVEELQDKQFTTLVTGIESLLGALADGEFASAPGSLLQALDTI